VETFGKSHEQTAKILGTGSRKISEARTVLDHADPKLREEIEQGKKSIHKAAQGLDRENEKK